MAFAGCVSQTEPVTFKWRSENLDIPTLLNRLWMNHTKCSSLEFRCAKVVAVIDAGPSAKAFLGQPRRCCTCPCESPYRAIAVEERSVIRRRWSHSKAPLLDAGSSTSRGLSGVLYGTVVGGPVFPTVGQGTVRLGVSARQAEPAEAQRSSTGQQQHPRPLPAYRTASWPSIKTPQHLHHSARRGCGWVLTRCLSASPGPAPAQPDQRA